MAKNRTIRTFDDGEFVIVCERVAEESLGFQRGYSSRRKWQEDRIALTREELRILADKYPVKD